MGEEFDDGDEDPVDAVGDDQGRHERRQGLAEEKLLAANRRREDRLKSAAEGGKAEGGKGEGGKKAEGKK